MNPPSEMMDDNSRVRAVAVGADLTVVGRPARADVSEFVPDRQQDQTDRCRRDLSGLPDSGRNVRDGGKLIYRGEFIGVS